MRMGQFIQKYLSKKQPKVKRADEVSGERSSPEGYVVDSQSGLPIIPSTYRIVEHHLTQRGQVGFLYFDLVQSRHIEETYGMKVFSQLLATVGQTFARLKGKLFREEDLVTVSSVGGDYFVLFLFSPPRHKESFGVVDLKIIAYRIKDQLEQHLAEQVQTQALGIQEKVTFHTGYTIITPDPNLTVERLIYEAQKEASLKCRLEEIMAQFVSNISHELRTPITCIKGYVETLLEGALNDEQTARRFLGIINEETNRLHRLVNDLLDLSMMESRRVQMHREIMEIGKLVEDAADFLRDSAEKKSITMTAEVPKNLPEVFADEDRLQQVLINIIGNAIKYTTEGGAIHIAAREDNGSIIVSVADTGVGIPPQDLPQIFERFYRVDKGRATDTGGRGLGLAIAKQIIEAHGGTIWAESQPQKGSTFSFSIPVSTPLD